MPRTIEIDDRQARELEEVARRERLSIDDLVRLAIGDYLARRDRDWSDWGRRFDELVARFRAGVPPGMTPEEIEAEITANWEEYRAERAAAASRPENTRHPAAGPAEDGEPPDAGAGGR